MNAITIAHISDIHYNPGDESRLSRMIAERGIDAKNHLSMCLEQLADRKPDLFALTGDLSHEGDAGAYRELKELFQKAFPHTPVLCAMGNHDKRGAFREGFLGLPPKDGPYCECMSIKGFRFLSLDTAWEKGVEGTLTDPMLDDLEDMLIKPAARGTVLLMHHPVMDAAKSMGFTMTERFSKILKSGEIIALLNGHVHGSYTGTVYGIPQFTADSLKTGCDLMGNTLTYNDRAGFQLITFDKKGDWMLERFLVRPKTDTFFTKEF